MTGKTHKTPFPIFAFLLFFAVLSAHSAFASEDPIDSILENLLRDDPSVSYEAEEVVIAFSQGEPKIIRYKVGRLKPNKMRREKYGLDGKVEEIVVNDDKLQIVSFPAKNIVIRSTLPKGEEHSGPKKEIISLIRKNYDIEFGANAAMSGRRSILVSIRPKAAGTRPSFKVWIDHETGMPLKTETYALDGSLSYLSSLFNIVINPSFPQDYFVIMVPQGTAAYEQQPAPPAATPSASGGKAKKTFIERLAGGYVLKEAMVGHKGHVQLVYHDGLNSISVFSEDWDNDKDKFMEMLKKGSGKVIEHVKRNGFEGFFCNRGAENVMSFISNKHRYVVVGEASKEGLIDIAVELKKSSLRR